MTTRSVSRSPWGTVALSLVSVLAASVLMLGVSALTGPFLPAPEPLAPVAEVPEVATSQESVAVDPDSVSDLPLPTGAVQQFIAPPGVDTAITEFVYAQYPQNVGELRASLVGDLSDAGWQILRSESVPPSTVVLSVVSPMGSRGDLRLEPLPRSVAGLRAQLSGALARAVQ